MIPITPMGYSRFFFYGTLKRGYNNYEHLLKGKALYVGEDHCSIPGVLFNVGFPGLCLYEQWSYIHGEIFDVPRSLIPDLDRLEGVPTFYHRACMKIGNYGLCSTYIWSKETADMRASQWIPSGRWCGNLTVVEDFPGWGKGPSLKGAPRPPIEATEAFSKARLDQIVKDLKIETDVRKSPVFVLKRVAGTEDQVYYVNTMTGEKRGPFRYLGDYVKPDGSKVPKIATIPKDESETATRVIALPTATPVDEKDMPGFNIGEKRSLIGPGSKPA